MISHALYFKKYRFFFRKNGDHGLKLVNNAKSNKFFLYYRGLDQQHGQTTHAKCQSMLAAIIASSSIKESITREAALAWG
ncbi:hypothetical protein [Pedomonas mirosovicensis]|uniref:hypothetical protein n=1 Tax=Pedomonas mirosovicensis TaxID=2908641 RepID=UPI00216984D0|nr:hypothetical protein [Pedomonas mirosovicensis]MCH8686646.1 hypothetical protein [Pedomonas mirosovicensis]